MARYSTPSPTPQRAVDGLRLVVATMRHVADEIDGEGYWQELAGTLRENATDLAQTATSIEAAHTLRAPRRERRRWLALLPRRRHVGAACDPSTRAENG
jgi:hypothetical protein